MLSDGILFFLVLGIILIHTYFSVKEVKRYDGPKTTNLMDQKSEYFHAGFAGSWKTKYHWGSIVIFIISLILFIQQFYR